VLVVASGRAPADGFLTSAAELCKVMGEAPVVLAVARSEAEARRLELTAEESFARCGVSAFYDFVVGAEAGSAVASVARWRRCTHVFVERRLDRSWWRPAAGDTLREFLGLSQSFALLTLPGEGFMAKACTQGNATSDPGYGHAVSAPSHAAAVVPDSSRTNGRVQNGNR
jgi:hypothetical protein